MIGIPSIFESAMAEVLIQHAPIEGEFPRIRTWRSIDAEGRWQPDHDRVIPVITITATTPEMGDQGQLQATVSVGAMTDASDDRDHRQIAMLESAIQDCIDALEARYPGSTLRPHYQTFLARIATETAGQSFAVHVGNVEIGASQEPVVIDGALAIAMEVIISYSRSDR